MLRVVAICAVALGCHLIVAADSDIIADDYPKNGTFVEEFTTKQPEREPRAEIEEQDQSDIIADDYPKNGTFVEEFTTKQPERGPRAEIEEQDQSEQSFCLRPPDVEGVISPVLESEEHPLGTVITYQCNFGYVSRSSGSLLSICRIDRHSGKAEWTHPNTTCIPRSCGDPGYVVNGRRVGNLFTFPNSVKFECLEGYKLQGLKERYCQASGEWSGRLPTCVPIYCPVPTKLKNGRVLYSSLDYGSELEYECDKGFMLQNYQPRTCNEDGIWSNDEPECIETTCTIPEVPEDVSVQLSENPPKVGTLAFYSCSDGATLVGASTSKCLSSGDWTFDPPKCLRSCYVPEIQDGELGRNQWNNRRRQEFVPLLEGQSVKHHELVTLRCKNGYSPKNRANGRLQEVECNHGAWSEPLYCHPTVCNGQPPPVENASPVITSREHGRSIWYKCDTGFGKKHGGNVTCQYGKWEGPTPACADHRCHMNELNYPGLVKPKENFINDGAHFKLVCMKAYKEASSWKKHVSCSKGKWDITTDPCIIKSCEDDPPSIVNGQPRAFARMNGSIVNYECEEGYQLEGHSTVHCAFGTWDGNPPVCKTSIKNLEVTTGKHLKDNSMTTNVSKSITNSLEEKECFCTFSYRRDILVAYWENLEIDSHHQIKKGERVLFICRQPNMDVVWPNGLRFNERTEQICDRCRDWQVHDLPSCEARDTAIKNLEATTEEQSKKESVTVNALKSTPNSLEVKECFCTFDYRKDVLTAYWKNSEIDTHHQIQKGEKVIFVCRHPNMDIVWPNGLRFYERIELICDRCQDWQIHDLPWCESRAPGDSLILYDINNPLKFLPRGIIAVPQSERISFTCINYWLPPQWQVPSTKGITVQKFPDSVSQNVYYREDITIEEMDNEHSGRYDCFAMYHNQKMRPTTVDLITAAFDVLCPELSTETNQGSFKIIYSNHRKIHSTAQHTCKDPLKRIVDSNERVCLENGKWSNYFPACEDIRCPLLNKNNVYSIAYTNNRKINSVAFYYCNAPHQRLIGSSNRTCLHSGEWSGTNPVCEDITCAEFPTYNGLSVTYSKGTKVGSIAQFSCLNHATLIGRPIIRCLHNGTWSQPKPSCEMLEIHCPKIDGKKIFTIKYSNSRKVNGTALFFCIAPNKKVAGCNFVTCQQNGEWSGDYPTCVDYVSCELFATSPNLNIHYTDAGQVGSTASFQCLSPRTLVGDSSATCLSNGIWSHSLPICAPPNCSIEILEESLTENLHVNLENVTDMSVVSGSEIPLICEEHLVLTGRLKALCNFHGKWEFADAQCIPACRMNKEEASRLIVEPEKDYYRFGEFVVLSCPPGLRLSSEVERMMCLGRTWSDTLPDCAELTEPNLPGITHTTRKI